MMMKIKIIIQSVSTMYVLPHDISKVQNYL